MIDLSLQDFDHSYWGFTPAMITHCNVASHPDCNKLDSYVLHLLMIQAYKTLIIHTEYMITN